MKIALFSSIIVLILMSFCALVVFAPYHLYMTVIEEGVKNSFLDMKKPSDSLLQGHQYNLEKMQTDFNEESNLWAWLRFKNYEVPFPLGHPQFVLVPLIKIKKQRVNLGISYQNQNYKELVEYTPGENIKFDYRIQNQKLFQIPIYNRYIFKKSSRQIWEDLFNMNISLITEKDLSFMDKLLTLWEFPINELVYRLFLLDLRIRIFGQDVKKISYYNSRSIGVVEHTNNQKYYSTEKFFMMDSGVVHTFTLRSLDFDVLAETLRQRIVSKIKYEKSKPDFAIQIYANYKRLNFDERTGQKGLSYLYAAWSHEIDQREYVREMIQFLERGKKNLIQLTPLYEYSQSLFGTNFSLKSSTRVESQDEKLKRLSKKEEDEFLKKEKRRKLKINENFSNPDEKIKFFIKRAKESEDLDSNEKVLEKY